jgi:very-short-patch-repair endonuclease
MNSSSLRGKSKLERSFMLYWEALGLAELESEFQFDPDRKWRFDFAAPAARVAVEIEGGVWSKGRHTRGAGFVADCEKYNSAALKGWAVFRLASGYWHPRLLKEIAAYIRLRELGELR